jgi:DNA recombination protein RmuC
MREAADKILAEVGHLISDVQRLRDRVENLDKHFGQANADIKQIVISADKIINRGDRIQSVEFDDEPPPSAEVIQAPIRHKLEASE